MDEFVELAKVAGRTAGRNLLNLRGSFHVRQKAPRDLVTEADITSQRLIQNLIQQAFPGHGFLGEESSPAERDQGAKSEFVWVVDPLDGTTNYVHDFPYYCVSIALLRWGQPLVGVIYDPTRDELYSAVKEGGAFCNNTRLNVSRVVDLGDALLATSFAADVGIESSDVQGFLALLPHAQAIRRCGSTALNMAYVARGNLDGYWSTSGNAWDVAAGVLLVQEAGGVVSGIFHDRPLLLEDCRLISASTDLLQRAIATILRQTTAE